MRYIRYVPGVLAGVAGVGVCTVVLSLQYDVGVLEGEDLLLASDHVINWWLWALVAVGVMWWLPRKVTTVLVLGGAVALSLGGLLADGCSWSSDQYRYRWDGKMQAQGVSPYAYPPVADEVAQYRDPWLFPDDAGCKEINKGSGCTRINYEEERTIYPPVAEGAFLVMHALGGPQEEDRARLWAGATSVGVVGLILLGLRRNQHNAALAAVYAWGPLHGLEAALDAHVDVLAVLLTLGALWVLSRDLADKRLMLLGGGLIGMAMAVKFYPGVVLLGFFSLRYARVWAAAGGVFLLSYVPYLIGSARDVVGYLPDYLKNEGYSSGERFLLLGNLGVPESLLVPVAGALLMLTASLVMAKKLDVSDLIGVALLIFNPVQTWYTLLLVALGIQRGRIEWVAVAMASYPMYAQLNEDKAMVGTQTYTMALLVVAVLCALRVLGWYIRRQRTPVGHDKSLTSEKAT